MTAARLSPAADLLRNSRLFAIPAAVTLPAVEPSSELISYSDSATTPYPTRAAIETSLASLHQGDWGLKRPLPVKTTKKSGTPLVRFRRGIDTPEHVVDFESAADHVLTLRKYQELNLRITLPAPRLQRALARPRTSAFEGAIDYTADQRPPVLSQHARTTWLDEGPSERAKHMPQHLKNTLLKVQKEKETIDAEPVQIQSPLPVPVSPEESPRRWRYSGPYLAGLNGLEFDTFLSTITREKRSAFRKRVKDDLIQQRAHKQRLKTLGEGHAEEASQLPAEVTEDDIAEHMRYLRSEPGKFGPLIVEFFDLADGPKPTNDMKDPWSYGRDTVAAALYQETGPPRTHPSAGLSYLKTETSAGNDPELGPRAYRWPVASRLLRSRQVDHHKQIPYVGVGGFVIPQPDGHTKNAEYNVKWEPVTNGPKVVVLPTSASVTQAGKLEIQSKMPLDYDVINDVAVDATGRPNPATTNSIPVSTRPRSSQLPTPSPARLKAIRSQPPPQEGQSLDDELEALQRMSARAPRGGSI